MGGYFELELPKAGKLPYPDALKYQSARVAFLALLRTHMPKRVWLPKYICDAMLTPLKTAGIEHVWYELDSNLDVSGEVQLCADDWLVYVNYFGLHKKNVDTLLERFPPQQIVLDYSQAFFEPPAEAAMATIYSPRKFFGIPDGGLLVGKVGAISVPERDVGSLDRSSHLLKRLAGYPEEGYADYRHAEETLSGCEPKRMSELTERILGAVDFDGARSVRHENFMFLHRELSGINPFEIDVAEAAAPLCYPFITNDRDLRQRMIANRIFVPTYWPEALGRVGDAWAEKMIRNLLPLPVDQRYGRDDMQRIVSIIRKGDI
ncbi:MAG: hypothetical protein IPM27_11715 [Nitrosomonadales bacterium]|nr:hypothetical protein [Nitrosomonadales bacterium]